SLTWGRKRAGGNLFPFIFVVPAFRWAGLDRFPGSLQRPAFQLSEKGDYRIGSLGNRRLRLTAVVEPLSRPSAAQRENNSSRQIDEIVPARGDGIYRDESEQGQVEGQQNPGIAPGE